MTVQELIDLLSGLPSDVQVIYQCYSEYEMLRPDELKLIKAEDKTITLRNGRYMRVNSWWLKHGEPTSDYATVVIFPGN